MEYLCNIINENNQKLEGSTYPASSLSFRVEVLVAKSLCTLKPKVLPSELSHSVLAK